MDEKKFMELVAELREAGFTQEEAIEEARERLSKDMAYGGRISYAMGTDEKVEMASGIEGIPININPQGVKELDFRNAIKDFCLRESIEIKNYLEACKRYTPFKKEYKI